MASHEKHSLHGHEKGKSVLEQEKHPLIDTMKTTYVDVSVSPNKKQRSPVNDKLSSTQECPLSSKKKPVTSNAKSNYSKKEAPKYTRLIQDVASGLNFQRTGLLALLDAIEAGSVATVVVAYKDRLARFGIQLIERTFRKHQTTLHVVSRDEDVHRSAESELAEDLLAVCNYFVAKNKGRRAAANAQRRREQQNLTSEDESSDESDDKSESDESETSSSE